MSLPLHILKKINKLNPYLKVELEYVASIAHYFKKINKLNKLPYRLKNDKLN